ncbi:hypothetical protein ACLOJK_028535 [Asimina triloba]
MGRPPCCDKSSVKKGLWTADEDAKILAYISTHGTGNWTAVPKKAGLKRCGKSCRLRWTNYLRPDLKHESFTPAEEQMIVSLHAAIGSRWSMIASQLPGRTDNDVKNHWNTKLRKKLREMGIDPVTHKPISQIIADYGRIGLPKGSSSSSTNTSNTQYASSHCQPPNTSRISCLNRDLKNAFLLSSDPSQTPQNEGFNFSMTTTTTAPQDGGAFNSMPSWDLLTQLQAIQRVAQVSSCSNQPTAPTHFLNDSPSFSSPTYLPNHSLPSFQNTVLSSSSSCSSPSSSFSWSDFLADDAFLQPPNQGEDLHMLSTYGSSSTNQIVARDETTSTNLQFENTAAGKKEHNGMAEKDDAAPNATAEEDPISQTFGAISNDSFVEKILDCDSEMLWAFPDLLD